MVVESGIWDRAINSEVVKGPSASRADAGVAFHAAEGLDASRWCLLSCFKTIWAVSATLIWRAGLMKTALADEPATSSIGAASAAWAR